MSRVLPPLPWSYQTNAPVGAHEGTGFIYLLDANGRKIETLWGTPDEKLASAELICDASDAFHVKQQISSSDLTNTNNGVDPH